MNERLHTASGFAALTARNAAEVEARKLCAQLDDLQREALVLAANGLCRKQIAARLGKSTARVEAYITQGRDMLEVDTTIEAAVVLTRAGLV